MKIPQTYQRLHDAALALQDLWRAWQKPNLGLDAFVRALCAFLMTARSVTFILRKEATAAYEAWFPQWWERLSAGERKLCDFMVEQRNRVEKEGKPDIFPKRKEFRAEHAPGVEVFGPSGALFPESSPAVQLVNEWYFNFNGETLVLPLCEQYLAILDRLVDDFAKAHPCTKRTP